MRVRSEYIIHMLNPEIICNKLGINLKSLELFPLDWTLDVPEDVYNSIMRDFSQSGIKF